MRYSLRSRTKDNEDALEDRETVQTLTQMASLHYEGSSKVPERLRKARNFQHQVSQEKQKGNSKISGNRLGCFGWTTSEDESLGGHLYKYYPAHLNQWVRNRTADQESKSILSLIYFGSFLYTY